jgi:hypothetical protein
MDSKLILFAMGNHLAGNFDQLLPAAIATPGVLRARFADAAPEREAPAWPHIAIYDVDREPAEVAAALFSRDATESLAIDGGSLRLVTASALTPRLLADSISDGSGIPLLFVVLTNPVDGREAEYNEWYDRRHLQDVLAIPGFVAAQRFLTGELATFPALPWKYLAIYEVAPDAVEAAFAEMDLRKGTERMPISDALDDDRFRALYAIAGTATA